MMAGCSDIVSDTGDETEERGDVIRLGGIETDILTLTSATGQTEGMTRAVENQVEETYRPSMAADSVSWLIQPLSQGLDITYCKTNEAADSRQVAILKLLTHKDGSVVRDEVSNYAVYTFRYRNKDNGAATDIDACWHGNGSHTFEGVHVPMRLRDCSYDMGEAVQKAENLTTDQHDDTSTGTDAQLGNYTLLSHYLGMPANCNINATVQRIKLPFKHRLARVLTFLLIDPELEGVRSR